MLLIWLWTFIVWYNMYLYDYREFWDFMLLAPIHTIIHSMFRFIYHSVKIISFSNLYLKWRCKQNGDIFILTALLHSLLSKWLIDAIYIVASNAIPTKYHVYVLFRFDARISLEYYCRFEFEPSVKIIITIYKRKRTKIDKTIRIMHI